MPTYSQTSTNRIAGGVLGVICNGAPNNRDVTGCTPGDSYTAEVYTIAVAASPDNSATYSVTASGDALAEDVLVSYTTDASATQAELVTGLKDAWNASAARTLGLATESGTTVTITGGNADTFSIVETADPSGKLTVTNTADGAAAVNYDIGHAVALTKPAVNSLAGEIGSKLSAPTLPSLLLTITHSASQTYSVDLTYTDQLGAVVTANLAFAAGGSAGATDTAAETAANALGWTGVTVTKSTGSITLTGYPGASFGAENPAGTGGADLAATITASSTKPQLGLILAPGAVEVDEATGVAKTTIPVNSSFDVLRGGRQTVPVPVLAGAAVGDAVYVDTTAGATNGALTVTPSATTWLLDGARVEAVADPGDSTLSHVTL